METWKNGAKGSEVQKIIENNFISLEDSIARISKQISQVYIKDFSASDWSSGTILIKQSEYNKTNPIVELYIKQDDNYSVVFGGHILTSNGIKLLSDINYEGRVVIR